MVLDRPRSSRPRSPRPAPRRRDAGLDLGPIPLTPTRTMLAIALAGSTAFVVWGLVARDASQIPLLVAGLVVYAIVFGALALGGAIATFRTARDGEAGRSFVLALVGGAAAIVAAGSLGVAIVLALMWGGAG